MHVTRAERVVARAALTVLSAASLALVWPQTFGGPTAFVGVDGDSMNGTYVDGDLIVVREQGSYDVGDVITYRVPAGEFGAGAHVIHRIVGGDAEAGFRTQGDNRDRPDEWRPRPTDILGASWVRVPSAAQRFQDLGEPVPLGALCAGLTVAVGLMPRRDRASAPETPEEAGPSAG